MEIYFMLIVCISVVLFGALISLGNERQKRALDGLREQITQWAIQDLKLKRERLNREIEVGDPLQWFNRLAAKATGKELRMQFSGMFEDLPASVFETDSFSGRVVFSPYSPAEVRRRAGRPTGRLSRTLDQNPLLSVTRSTWNYELSALNCGVLFDLELKKAWEGLTGRELDGVERLWIYTIS